MDTARDLLLSHEPTSSRGVWTVDRAEPSGGLMREHDTPQDVMWKFWGVVCQRLSSAQGDDAVEPFRIEVTEDIGYV